MSMRVKLADFGLAYQEIFDGTKSYFNIRWAAPEIWENIKKSITDCDEDEYNEDDADEPEHSPDHNEKRSLEKEEIDDTGVQGTIAFTFVSSELISLQFFVIRPNIIQLLKQCTLCDLFVSNSCSSKRIPDCTS